MNVFRNIDTAKVICLTVVIVLDILSGCIKAFIDNSFKSSEFRTGILKKILDYILVIVGCMVDTVLETEYVCTGVLISLIFMECYSVLENINGYVPLPESLKKIVEEHKEGD